MSDPISPAERSDEEVVFTSEMAGAARDEWARLNPNCVLIPVGDINACIIAALHRQHPTVQARKCAFCGDVRELPKESPHGEKICADCWNSLSGFHPTDSTKGEEEELPALDVTQADYKRADELAAADDESTPNRIGPWERVAFYERQLKATLAELRAVKAERDAECDMKSTNGLIAYRRRLRAEAAEKRVAELEAQLAASRPVQEGKV